MIATPTALSVLAGLSERLPVCAAPARRENGLWNAFALFRLSRRIALHIDAGRTPPRWLLDELGIRAPE